MPRILVLLMAVLTIAACSNEERDIGLRDLRSNSAGPDEFLVLPSKDLQQPTDYASLPTPTPGGRNLTDQNPVADGITALGGRASALVATAEIPAADSALLAHASRNGISADIRTTLDAEDEEFRRFNSRFTRLKLVKVDRYDRAYRKFALDPSVEADKWREFGVQTPSAPPR
ncbi:DUF3035 domain-containing protein [Thalassobius sp. Cn5-15]|uniref:DUF3035 domain-containing protein n=1 Tax=Thalassobius sp. Cn5-15 TaxID=2917763 RepID=UPI001EF3B7FF|nr:DUF3035 domain-containing protein [Thalassobius sp. Cn5-15]MCG7494907.1 DUF3035 domain-containing protein [Thalassobius sp. Cn5-15]